MYQQLSIRDMNDANIRFIREVSKVSKYLFKIIFYLPIIPRIIQNFFINLNSKYLLFNCKLKTKFYLLKLRIIQVSFKTTTVDIVHWNLNYYGAQANFFIAGSHATEKTLDTTHKVYTQPLVFDNNKDTKITQRFNLKFTVFFIR